LQNPNNLPVAAGSITGSGDDAGLGQEAVTNTGDGLSVSSTAVAAVAAAVVSTTGGNRAIRLTRVTRAECDP